WRNLGKSKMHSFINIFGLAIGMAVSLLIGLWLYDEISFDKNFQHYDRIARVLQNVTNNGEVQTWTNMPYPLGEELRKNYGSNFKHVITAANIGNHTVLIDNKKVKVSGGYFEHGIPEMLSLQMRQGNHGSLDDPASALISVSAAKANFGETDPLNKIIKIDDNPPIKISGVYEDFPSNSTFADLNFISTWEFLYNNSDDIKSMTDPWRPNFTSLYVQLNDNIDIDKASLAIKDAKMKKVNEQLQKKKPALFLHSMSKWHLYSEFRNGFNTGGAIQYIRMFGISGLFVLLLACINFMNLSTARSEKRAKEVGIRKTVGSLRSQLIGQFFAESLLTVGFAFAMSLLFVRLLLPFFNTVSSKHLSILWSNQNFWLINLAFIGFTSIIAGSYPAFYLSSFEPVKVLKGTFQTGRLAALPRKVLVVLQFTVSITLIIGTMIVYRQILYAKNRPVGYSRDGLVNVYMETEQIHKHFEAVKEELVQAGAISSMAESGSPTTGIWGSTSGISWKQKDPNLSTDFGTVNASYDFGHTIDWKLKEGRDFSREFGSDTSAVILNVAAAEFMGLKKPIGEIVTWWDVPYTVVGVINDMVMTSPYEEPKPIVYSLSTGTGNVILLRINPKQNAKTALSTIETVFKKYNPEQAFAYRFVDEEYAQKFGDEERIGKLAGFFSLLAVFISCLGLFGLTSFVAEQRQKEIGVRKVLGASIFNVWNLLSKDFVLLVGLSFLFAIPISIYFMSGWLSSYTYRTGMSWFIFAAAAMGSILITLLTVSFQAIRAAIANPIKSLRTE
ncbi:MAG: ABC transporter permease, partial [Saprospiraceae bacterium]